MSLSIALSASQPIVGHCFHPRDNALGLTSRENEIIGCTMVTDKQLIQQYFKNIADHKGGVNRARGL
jgi:hypothetical protein